MKDFSLKDIIKYAVVLFFVAISVMFFSTFDKWASNQEVDLKIKKEVHVANLLGQYQSDLNACLAEVKSKTVTEEQCIDEMNSSNLAKLIVDWGYESALVKFNK